MKNEIVKSETEKAPPKPPLSHIIKLYAFLLAVTWLATITMYRTEKYMWESKVIPIVVGLVYLSVLVNKIIFSRRYYFKYKVLLNFLVSFSLTFGVLTLGCFYYVHIGEPRGEVSLLALLMVSIAASMPPLDSHCYLFIVLLYLLYNIFKL